VNPFDLAGRAALVTGGNGGTGAAIPVDGGFSVQG
jgi:hypothetical protein